MERLIPSNPCAIFYEDQGQWNTHCKIDAEVSQSAWTFGEIEETDVNKCGGCDEDDQSICRKGMMQDSVQASIPRVRNDCQREREIEDPQTTQGEQRHHFWKDARIGADVADLCGQSIQAEEADE